jgi:hypothetical protein
LASVHLALGQKFRLGDDATREGWRYQHIQAIIVAIDQYAEAATGNRDFFLNKPPGAVGTPMRSDVPCGKSSALRVWHLRWALISFASDQAI